jgi:hypothetical protein
MQMAALPFGSVVSYVRKRTDRPVDCDPQFDVNWDPPLIPHVSK